ncbi:hypothetical protein M0802_015534 [Mischocyttarus mexicanus]|nr:hypothetical protein M0802_015534 [Mischocyttarus mexicanus]
MREKVGELDPAQGSAQGNLRLSDSFSQRGDNDCGNSPASSFSPALEEAYRVVRAAEGLVPPRARAALGVLARKRAIAEWREEEITKIRMEVPGERVRLALA